MSYIDTPRRKATRVLSSIYDRNPKFRTSPRSDVSIIHSKYQRRTFNSTDPAQYQPYYISPPTINNGTRIPSLITRGKPNSVTALDVFLTNSILPYKPNFSFQTYEKEIELLAKSIPSQQTRSPMLYRLSEKWVLDDLGRFYYFKKDPNTPTNNRQLYWMQYNLSSDLRNTITLSNDTGRSLKLAVYTFVGLSGYHPGVQDHFISSGKYQFHHVAENKLDLRPTSIVPLESHLHNYIHDQYTLPGSFFKRTKLFYI